MNAADRQFSRLAAAARGFVFVALLASGAWSQDQTAVLATLIVGGIWVLAQTLELRPGLTVAVSGVAEAVAIGVVCGATMDASIAALGVLAVPPFTGGIYRGARGMGLSLSGELTALVVVSFLFFDSITPDQSVAIFTWVVTGLGLGLVACFVRSALIRSHDPLTPYHYAQTLIRQLIGLSGELSQGLDPTVLGGSILSAVRDDVPCSTLTVYVPRDESLVPLVSKSFDESVDLAESERFAARAWRQSAGLPMLEDDMFALVLITDAAPVGVVCGTLSADLYADRLAIRDRLRRLTRSLHSLTVQLDTALLFARFRDSATAEERRRLSREMHDGVAQDIASLGYLVDVVALSPPGPKQEQQLDLLRERISAVVGEVRRQVITLRTSVGTSESLGGAISSIARNLSQVSGTPITVSLDEHPTRLRPETEAELFRIAQEAMNNAVKHAECTQITVHCQVHAPDASITVTDNGRGMGVGRSDSFGLGIMQERAHLIGGRLSMTETPGGGLTVRVVLGNAAIGNDAEQVEVRAER